jgi:hypothetical protein
MKNLPNILIFILVAGGIFAGYKWRKGAFSSHGDNGKTYAVIVGISDYLHGGQPNQINNLRFCDDDAHLFYSFLKTAAGGSVPEENIALLIDNKASKANILQQMNTMFAKSGPNDRVIFYFAGHGNNGYFATYDVDLGNPATNLDHREVKEAFRRCHAKTRLCFADACRSGSMKNIERKRSISPEATSRAVRSFEDEESGLVVLMATRSYQNAGESMNIAHGYFTKFLVEGLEGKADRNADQLVSIREAFDYLYMNLSSLPKDNSQDKGQLPVIFGKYDPDMPVASLKSA